MSKIETTSKVPVKLSSGINLGTHGKLLILDIVHKPSDSLERVKIKCGECSLLKNLFVVCVCVSAHNWKQLFSWKNTKTYKRWEEVFQEKFGYWDQVLLRLTLFPWKMK